MNELKNVTNKLFKTELTTQKVELGIVQDSIKIVDSAEKGFEGGFAEISNAKSKAIPVIKNAISNAEKFLTQFEETKKTAKELGIELPADYLKQETRAKFIIGESKDVIDWLNKY